MTFTSFTYLLFVPLVFACYWGVRAPSARNAVIVGASYVFYGWWDYRFCGLMLLSTLLDYAVARGIEASRDGRRRRMLLGFSIAGNLAILGAFKYYNFFVESFVSAASAAGWTVSAFTIEVVLPAGISFYTFQTMSYTIDVYRGELPACRSFLQAAAYVSFFPQLVAGPIERASRLLPQFGRAATFDRVQASEGARLVLWGFFKKLVIADNLAPVVDAAYGAPAAATGPVLAFATVCFAFQIYCDFSAYSDIARGSARWFGIELMRNFDRPYFAGSISEFWGRWHISLSTWFRDYVYVPLGGSRVPAARRGWNVFATFMISGLWHGAAWTFVAWGALNGAAVVLERLFGLDGRAGASGTRHPVRRAVAVIRTFALTCLFWVFFRAASVSDAWLILRKIAFELMLPAAYAPLYALATTGVLRTTALVLTGAFVLVEGSMRRSEHPFVLDGWPRPVRWTVYSVCVWLTLALTAPETGQFIYFQF